MTAPTVDEVVADESAPESGSPETEKVSYGDEVTQGKLMTLTGVELAKYAHKLFRSQDRLYSRRLAEWRMNDRRRQGEYNLYISKHQDLDRYTVQSPPGGGNMPLPVYNLSDRLCQLLLSQQFADDYKPEVEPASGSDEDKDAADVAQRALEDADAEGNLNHAEMQRQAMDKGHTGGSGYVLYWVDPRGGGRHPIQIEAHPNAPDVSRATYDPETGLPVPPTGLTLRYVTPDGMLTDKPAEAALQWWPKLRAKSYHARHVRFLPSDAMNIQEADGVMVAEYITWGELVRLYPDLAGWGTEQIEEAAKERPKGWSEFLPWVDGKPTDTKRTDDTPEEEWIVPHLRVWVAEGPFYPDGAFVAIIGKDTVVTSGGRGEPWIGEDEQGRFKLDLPLAQLRLWRDPTKPHGKATMDILGDAAESRATIMSMFYDVCDRIAHRKTFVPTNSILSGKEMLLDSQDYIPINPGGEPIAEEIPAMPADVGFTFRQVTEEMNNAVYVAETAQGIENTSSQSGRAKLAVISQVHANLSDLRKNVVSSYTRGWGIMLKLMRWKYDKPQQMRWVGQDGAYKLGRWYGADLAGVNDVKLRPGTGTMLPPMQKIEQAVMLQQTGLVDIHDLRDTLGAQVGAVTGARDNPHLLRVRRQIATWEEAGETAQDIPPQQQQQPGPPMLDPATGMQVPGPPQVVTVQPPDPTAMQIFAPLPVDAQPDVALIRVRELGRVMAGVQYMSYPASWREALNIAYQGAQQAAAPPMPMQAAPQQGGGAGSPQGETSGIPTLQLSATERAMAGQ